MSLPEQHRRLADVIELLEELDGCRIAETRGGGPAEGPEPFTATVTIAIGDVEDSTDSPPSIEDTKGCDPSSMYGDEVIPVEAGDEDDESNADADEASDETDTADEDDNGGESDDDDEVACDVDGCGYSGTERGLAVHKGRAHSDDDAEAPTPDEIKALRDSRNWTQAELGTELGVGESTVANWEAGYNNPSGEAIKALHALIDSNATADSDPDITSNDETTDDEELLSETDGGAVAADVDDTDGRDSEDPPHLPENVTVDEVEELAVEHRYLSDVADALNLSDGQARALLVNIGSYAEVREGGRR